MPHRYKAPEHTSSISAPTREIAVGDDGFIELPDDAPDVEVEYLRRAGCVLAGSNDGKSGAVGVSASEPAQESQKAENALSEPENAPAGDVSGMSKTKA